MKSIVILISGRGSNMEALLGAHLRARIAAVISNNVDAKGLAIAAARGVTTEVVNHRHYDSRESFDQRLAQCIEGYRPDLVILAGFMRILTDGFVESFKNRLINIHPSLLPAFPGTNTHRRALQEGVKIHGCTVHFVTPALDSGPIIAQAAVPVFDDDSESTLAARVVQQEHRLLPEVVRWFLDDRLRVDGRRVALAGTYAPAAFLISPALQ